MYGRCIPKALCAVTRPVLAKVEQRQDDFFPDLDILVCPSLASLHFTGKEVPMSRVQAVSCVQWAAAEKRRRQRTFNCLFSQALEVALLCRLHFTREGLYTSLQLPWASRLRVKEFREDQKQSAAPPHEISPRDLSL